VTGYLQSQNYKEGDQFKKGDLLFEIDCKPFQGVLGQAKGQLAQPRRGSARRNRRQTLCAPRKDRATARRKYDDAVQAKPRSTKRAVVAAKAQVEQAEVNLDLPRLLRRLMVWRVLRPGRLAILSARPRVS